jgi:hypothetical protein
MPTSTRSLANFAPGRQDENVRKWLAKLLARMCMRDTELENLHAGIVPSSEAGDYSDVKVASSGGEIPSVKLKRVP